MFKKILIPLDGSEHSLKIVGWATGLARALQAQIILFSVVDSEEIETFWAGSHGTGQQAGSTPDGGVVRTTAKTPVEIIVDTMALAKKMLSSEAMKVRAAGVEASVHVDAGSPAEMIVSEAHTLGVDLIAMATRRESALARGILGSVTDRVLHSTAIPVLTLYPGELDSFGDNNGPPDRVIVPLDGSELSESAVAPAIGIAKAAGAGIVFTETVRLPFFGIGVAGIEYGAGDYAADLGIDSQKQEISKYLQGFVERAESSGVEARASVRTGSPAQQIVEEASESTGSMIVMASRGAGGLKRWVLGSVADKVIRSARRPVLVIPHSTV